jgi:hypothetical protein
MWSVTAVWLSSAQLLQAVSSSANLYKKVPYCPKSTHCPKSPTLTVLHNTGSFIVKTYTWGNPIKSVTGSWEVASPGFKFLQNQHYIHWIIHFAHKVVCFKINEREHNVFFQMKYWLTVKHPENQVHKSHCHGRIVLWGSVWLWTKHLTSYSTGEI